MKLLKIGAAFALTTALVAGGLAAPAAYAEEAASTERYLVSLEAPANAQWKTNKEVFASTAQSMADKMSSSGIKVDQVFTSIGVVAADMTKAQAEALKKTSGVQSVSEDREMVPATTQYNSPWHLDRLDQAAWNYSTRDGKYTYEATGSGVTGYVVDSGIDPEWPDIKGRVLGGVNFSGDSYGWKGCQDGEHGTKVATSMGGTKYGVAKGVKFVSLRVFPCQQSGTGQMLLDALDWIMKNGQKPSVVNMSLSFRGVVVPVVDEAVQRLFYAGFPIVIAAGNYNADACNNSPGRTPEAITVAASNSADQETDFSNYGSCIDLYAPGEQIQFHDNTGYNARGTSFASPIVAGAAAQYLQANPGATPQQVAAAAVNTSFKDKITNPTAGTPNRLLNALGMSKVPQAPWTMSNDSTKVTGTHAFVWGTLPAGSTSAWTEVKTASGWKKSQTRTANSSRYVRIPLTYGITKAGKYTYRVGTKTPYGTTRYTSAFVLTRTPLTVTVTPRAKLYASAYMWGKVPTALNRTVDVQVLVNGKWRTVSTVKASKTGYVKVPLTWGRSKPGRYTFRAIFNTRYGKVYSKGATVVRYR